MEKKFLYGDRIKELRKPKEGNSLSMDELCEIFKEKYGLNVNKSMISRWETGLSVPDNKHIVAYAKHFDVDMNYLIGLTNVKRKLSDIVYSNNKREDEYLSDIVNMLKDFNEVKLSNVCKLLFQIKKFNDDMLIELNDIFSNLNSEDILKIKAIKNILK
ncbi:helix-turn-helix domain-containing protein [Fusobacterium watanabei]|uniref:helix-turn-helix domain-containing protein n=1 Tax=Fusobacterium watanabei TaxID=2686067 RepID=UPI003B58802F